MIFLILTRSGFDGIRLRIEVSGDAVWLNAGVLGEAEVATLRSGGWNVTTFRDPLSPHDLDSDIETVRQHHPGQIIWVEAVE